MVLFVSDTFTEASTTELDAHAAETGGTWVEEENTSTRTFRVIGGAGIVRASGDQSNRRMAYSAGTAATTGDVDVTFEIEQASTAGDEVWVGVFARWTTVDDYYALVVTRDSATNSIEILKSSGGVLTRTQGDATIAAGDFFKLQIRSNVLDVFRDSGSGFGSSLLTLDDSSSPVSLGDNKVGLLMGGYPVSTGDIRDEWRIESFTADEFPAVGGTILPQMMQHYHGGG